MDERKTGWEKIMKCLEETVSKNTVDDCNELCINVKVYNRLWQSVYCILKGFSGLKYKRVPRYVQVRSIVRINGLIAKLIDHCIVSEESTYSEKTFELRCKITKDGIESTSINIIKGEAAEPLHPASIFHSFKKMFSLELNTINSLFKNKRLGIYI